MKFLADELKCRPHEVEAKLAGLSVEELRELYEKCNTRCMKLLHHKLEATQEGGLVAAATYDGDLEDAMKCVDAIRAKSSFF